MKKFIVLTALAALAVSPIFEAEAATTKLPSSRSDYSKEQQKMIYDDGIKLCRKKLRTHLNFINVDYKKKVAVYLSSRT